MIRGLIFDLDGTLFDSEAAYFASLTAVGIDPRAEAYRNARRSVKARMGERHVNAHNRLLYFKTMLENERRFSPRETLSLMGRYESALQEHVGAQWRALGRPDFFAELKRRNLPVVLLTNENTRTQLLKLEAIDPDGRIFTDVITSEDFGEEKPGRRVFAAAVERLGENPEDCAMVGDDFEADVEPALSLGLRALLTTEFRNDAGDRRPDVLRIARLGEVLTHLAEWGSK